MSETPMVRVACDRCKDHVLVEGSLDHYPEPLGFSDITLVQERKQYKLCDLCIKALRVWLKGKTGS